MRGVGKGDRRLDVVPAVVLLLDRRGAVQERRLSLVVPELPDLEKHGERVSGTRTPLITRQNTKNTLRHTGTTKLNSQNGKPSVSVPANLNSNCKR